METVNSESKRSDAGETLEKSETKLRLKKVRVDGEADAAVMRVVLPANVASKLREAIMELKDRGAAVTAEELLSPFWGGMKADYIETQVTKGTPDDYYLEAARKVPELREKLIQQAKRALSATMKIPSRLKRQNRHKVDSAIVTSAVIADQGCVS